MPQVPLLSTNGAIRVFESFGWRADRQRGSHIMMTKPGEISTLSLPARREVPRGTLRSLIRASGISFEDFNSRCSKLL